MAIQYLNSTSIKAYPTDNRGKNDSTDVMFNPESHFYSESNANKIGGTEIATRKSFAYETGDSLLIVIDGYRFDLSKSELISLVGSPSLNDSLYAGIRVVEGDQTNHEFAQLAQVVSDGAFGTILDYKASDDSDYRFYGLAFSKSQSELTSNGATSTLQVFACKTAGTWEIPDSSKIVLSTDRVAQYRNGDLDPTPISKEFDTGIVRADKADIAYSISSPTISGNTVMCNSASSTRDKAIDLTGFNYDDGATINVLFKNGNTAENPRLKINGETPVPICISRDSYPPSVAGIPAGTTPATSWSDGETISLVYQLSPNVFMIVGGNRVSLKSEVSDNSSEGMYIVGVTEDAELVKELKKNTSITFKKGDMNLDSLTATELIHSPTITGNYATCSTAASTADKLINLRGFVLAVGAVVNVKFTHKNTAVSPRLKVQTATSVYSYINIMQNNGASVAGVDEYASWDDGDVVSFVVVNVPVSGSSSCVMLKPLNVVKALNAENAFNDWDGNEIMANYAHSMENSFSDGVNTITISDMNGDELSSIDIDTVANSENSENADMVKMVNRYNSDVIYYPLLRNSNSTANYNTADYTSKIAVNASKGSVYSVEYHGERSNNETVYLKLDSAGASIKESDGSNNNVIRISTSTTTVSGVETKWATVGTDRNVIGIYDNVYPRNSNTYSLGSSSYKWKNIYATTVYATTFDGTASYAQHIGTASSHPAIGSSKQPVYVNSSGDVTACSSTVGDTNVPVYLSSGEVTQCSGFGMCLLAQHQDNIIVGGLYRHILGYSTGPISSGHFKDANYQVGSSSGTKFPNVGSWSNFSTSGIWLDTVLTEASGLLIANITIKWGVWLNVDDDYAIRLNMKNFLMVKKGTTDVKSPKIVSAHANFMTSNMAYDIPKPVIYYDPIPAGYDPLPNLYVGFSGKQNCEGLTITVFMVY